MLQLFGAKNRETLPFLAAVLQRAYGLKTLPELSRTAWGKPFFPAHPQLHFSLSHSGPYLLCALDLHPVGTDIEVLRPRSPGLPRYALTPSEYEAYLAFGGDWPAFYRLWTKKEAWAKYLGDGLARHLRQAPPESGLYFGSYEGIDFRGTVCGETPPPESICWLDL